MRRIGLAALAVSVASGAMAQGYDGSYQLDQCSPYRAETRIEVTGFQIQYYESTCTMTNPVPVRDMDGAFLFDAICNGEGQTWTERVFMMAFQGDGLLQVRRGHPFTYQRCP